MYCNILNLAPRSLEKSTVYAICKVNTQMLRKMVCNNKVISVPTDGLAVLDHLQTSLAEIVLK